MKIKDKIKELKQECQQLELSDERLFSNGNGNLPHYKVLQAEIAVLSAKYQHRKVKCIETGEIFDSSAAACRALGCGKSAMANHLAGRFPSIRGKRFERV